MSKVVRAALEPVRALVPRATDSCHPQPDVDLCEKPASANVTYIVLGIIGGILAVTLACVLFAFHLRRKRHDEEEWPKGAQELDDYGFVEPGPQSGSGKGHLQPPTYQSSAESTVSLARSLRSNDNMNPFVSPEETTAGKDNKS